MNWSYCFLIIKYAFLARILQKYIVSLEHFGRPLRYLVKVACPMSILINDMLEILTDGFSIDNSWLNQECKMVA